jgi:hypothetical protein
VWETEEEEDKERREGGRGVHRELASGVIDRRNGPKRAEGVRWEKEVPELIDIGVGGSVAPCRREADWRRVIDRRRSPPDSLMRSSTTYKVQKRRVCELLFQ